MKTAPVQGGLYRRHSTGSTPWSMTTILACAVGGGRLKCGRSRREVFTELLTVATVRNSATIGVYEKRGKLYQKMSRDFILAPVSNPIGERPSRQNKNQNQIGQRTMVVARLLFFFLFLSYFYDHEILFFFPNRVARAHSHER